eukprot:CFRG7267T1
MVIRTDSYTDADHQGAQALLYFVSSVHSSSNHNSRSASPTHAHANTGCSRSGDDGDVMQGKSQSHSNKSCDNGYSYTHAQHTVEHVCKSNRDVYSCSRSGHRTLWSSSLPSFSTNSTNFHRDTTNDSPLQPAPDSPSTTEVTELVLQTELCPTNRQVDEDEQYDSISTLEYTRTHTQSKSISHHCGTELQQLYPDSDIDDHRTFDLSSNRSARMIRPREKRAKSVSSTGALPRYCNFNDKYNQTKLEQRQNQSRSATPSSLYAQPQARVDEVGIIQQFAQRHDKSRRASAPSQDIDSSQHRIPQIASRSQSQEPQKLTGPKPEMASCPRSPLTLHEQRHQIRMPTRHPYSVQVYYSNPSKQREQQRRFSLSSAPTYLHPQQHSSALVVSKCPVSPVHTAVAKKPISRPPPKARGCLGWSVLGVSDFKVKEQKRHVRRISKSLPKSAPDSVVVNGGGGT